MHLSCVWPRGGRPLPLPGKLRAHPASPCISSLTRTSSMVRICRAAQRSWRVTGKSSTFSRPRSLPSKRSVSSAFGRRSFRRPWTTEFSLRRLIQNARVLSFLLLLPTGHRVTLRQPSVCGGRSTSNRRSALSARTRRTAGVWACRLSRYLPIMSGVISCAARPSSSTQRPAMGLRGSSCRLWLSAVPSSARGRSNGWMSARTGRTASSFRRTTKSFSVRSLRGSLGMMRFGNGYGQGVLRRRVASHV